MKIAIVTGGTKGLGKTISETLSTNGYKVYAVSRNPLNLGKNIITKKADISSKSKCKSLIKYIIKKEGRIDLLVNNAGINDNKNIEKTFQTNVFGPTCLINSAMPILKKNKGKVINITSINGLVPTPESSIYSASKHALEGFSVALSYESEVNITNIAPGVIHNPNSKALSHTALRGKYPILNTLFPLTTTATVASKVVEISKMDSPPKRMVVGIDAQIAFLASRYFPEMWFWIIQKMYSRK